MVVVPIILTPSPNVSFHMFTKLKNVYWVQANKIVFDWKITFLKTLDVTKLVYLLKVGRFLIKNNPKTVYGFYLTQWNIEDTTITS